MSKLNQDTKADSDGAGESATPNGDVEIDMKDILSTDLSVTFKNVEPERQQKADPSQDNTKEQTGTVAEDDEDVTGCCSIFAWRKELKNKLQPYRQVLIRCVRVVLVLLYLAYSGYALYRQWGTESATRLWLVLAIVLWLNGGGRITRQVMYKVKQAHVLPVVSKRGRNIIRWILYLAATAGAVVYLAVEVAPHHPYNLMSLAGIAVLLLVGILLSTHPEKVNWHTVFWGLSLQFYLALFLLRTQAGGELFDWLGHSLEKFIAYTDEGSKFLFGEAYTMHPNVFKTMPIIVFMNCVIAAGYHVGAAQAFIASFGRFLAWCLDTTPVESVNASANIFLGLAEAPLVIKPFIEHVTESELFAIMTGGFASIAGATTGTIIGYGVPANHILAASVMSAPAALAIAKVMCPAERTPDRISVEDVYKVELGQSSSLLEAVSKAAMGGVAIVVTVCANVLVFIAFIAFADRSLEWFGDQVGAQDLTLSLLMGYLFYPLMYVCGVDSPDLMNMGRLAGLKMLAGSFVSFQEVGVIITNSETFNNYTTFTNGTWHYDGFDVILDDWDQTLAGGVFTDRSLVISTYILCGFGNISTCAITIGTMSALAPSRTRHVIKHVVWACIAGNIACFLTGCIAGLLHT